VSPPAATTDAKAAGVALSAKTFSAFTGADAGSIDGYTARVVNASGSCSWSGSGLGPYTPTSADGDAGVLALDATISGTVVATALHDYARAASASGWVEKADVDLSDGDITDLTLTKGAGDTNVLNSAGTSTRVVAGYLDTVNTSVGTCVASTANAGIRVSNSQNNSEAASYWHMDPATYGQDMSALDKAYMISVRVRNATVGTSNNDTIGTWCSSGGNHRTAGLAFGVQQFRSGANYIFRAIRSESGSQSVGANLRSSGSVQADYVCTYVVWRGRLCDVYITLGTTMPTTIPTPGPTVLHTVQGNVAISIDTGPSGFADLYAVTQVYSGGGSSAATVDRVEILELDG
jgi:hypothetical protein